MAKKVLIMGAAGRDFHNFNVFYRNNKDCKVVAFTANQIPDIDGRLYPPELAGELYPEGIPIYDESELTKLIKELEVEEVVFAYSDIKHKDIMHKASTVLAAGPDFRLMGPDSTCIKSTKPVVSICAVRTGVGKSQTTRAVVEILREEGLKVVSIRHPMPYGDLAKQACQRFAKMEDLDFHKCTIEEREEYAPHIEAGSIIYSGVDYEKIVREAEKEADIILWDGGNNDFPFYKSDYQIVLADPLRAGDEVGYHPGETNIKMADCIIICKIDSATKEQLETVRGNIKSNNPGAKVIEAASIVTCEDESKVKGKKVLVIEDGPTLTHGEMSYGAGVVLCNRLGAKELIDPRPYAKGSIEGVYKKFKHIGHLLPAMGYSDRQISELKATIDEVPCETIVIGTPIDLSKVIDLPVPSVRVAYDLDRKVFPDLKECLKPIITKAKELKK